MEEKLNAEEALSLGDKYFYGDGVEEDYKKAYGYYLVAAEEGSDKAEFNLGVCNYYGIGVEKNIPEAERRFKNSADLGNADGAYNYALCLMDRGQFKEAFAYLEKCGDNADAGIS